MRYVDTSVLLAYLMPEAESAVAEKFMLSAGEALAISSWTEVELLSALSVKVRTRQLTKTAANAVIETYGRLVAPAQRCIVLRSMMLIIAWR